MIDKQEIEQELKFIEKIHRHVEQHKEGMCKDEWGANQRRTDGIIDTLRWVLYKEEEKPSHTLTHVSCIPSCLQAVIGIIDRRKVERRAK